MNISKNKIKYLIIVFIVILGISSVYLLIPKNNNKLEEYLSNEGMFAILVEDANGNYIEYSNSVWPSNNDFTYNSTKSSCVDKEGNKIENVLTFDSTQNIAYLSTEQTSYCYLYFDRID